MAPTATPALALVTLSCLATAVSATYPSIRTESKPNFGPVRYGRSISWLRQRTFPSETIGSRHCAARAEQRGSSAGDAVERRQAIFGIASSVLALHPATMAQAAEREASRGPIAGLLRRLILGRKADTYNEPTENVSEGAPKKGRRGVPTSDRKAPPPPPRDRNPPKAPKKRSPPPPPKRRPKPPPPREKPVIPRIEPSPTPQPKTQEEPRAEQQRSGSMVEDNQQQNIVPAEPEPALPKPQLQQQQRDYEGGKPESKPRNVERVKPRPPVEEKKKDDVVERTRAAREAEKLEQEAKEAARREEAARRRAEIDEARKAAIEKRRQERERQLEANREANQKRQEANERRRKEAAAASS